MRSFIFIDKLIRHGLLIAGIAAAAVLVVGFAVLFGVTTKLFWTTVCAFAAIVVFCAVMLLRDIARVIAETLIPMP